MIYIYKNTSYIHYTHYATHTHTIHVGAIYVTQDIWINNIPCIAKYLHATEEIIFLAPRNIIWKSWIDLH